MEEGEGLNDNALADVQADRIEVTRAVDRCDELWLLCCVDDGDGDGDIDGLGEGEIMPTTLLR